jgi:hypothetical protein
MKGDWIGNCIWCGEVIYEGYRHRCWTDKNGAIKVCECDEADSPYPSCEECPWNGELEFEEEEV